jgi:hypothetical protein
MKAPDERTQKAIKVIKYDEEFKIFRTWLSEQQAANDNDLRKVGVDKLGHYQGISHALDVILTATGPR